jgi:alpha-tubulin suppressor-like RCC1 family protein
VPGQTSARFYANSTSSRTGTIPLSIVIAGVNAPRYEAIESTTFRVLPAGLVLLPPNFTMTQYTTTPQYNLDLSVVPNKIFWIDIIVELNNTNATNNVTVSPTRVYYNETQRGTFNVTANGTGYYFLRFTINGENVPNYIKPTSRVQIYVQDPLDGPAFEARLRRGYLNYRKACRIVTGRRSIRFDGQDENVLREEFCGDIPRPFANETNTCGRRTSSAQCEAAVEQRGHACAWFQGKCVFLPTIHGNIQHAQFGSGFTVFLTLTGEVHTIGVDRYGQLGHHNATGLGKVPLPESIATIAVGNNHVLALSYEGRVYTWGVNSKGQLGQNTRASSSVTPGLVVFPKGENITCISSGLLHASALTLSGRLYTWGSNEFGQLGTQASYRSFVNSPRLIQRDSFGGDAAIAIQCGEYHTMVATDNNAYTFGSNFMGQLGRVGFDEWKPKSPVLWVRNKYNQGPKYPSYWLGKQC